MQTTTSIQEDLLKWYNTAARNLPWRNETDPYRIWVSEVMLQQTQVATVIPYYNRFLNRFPTIEVLAEASLDVVLKEWAGLGYYARARNLHKAAREIVANYNGHLPDAFASLRRLPGFGPYTAGAVASIAFGEAVPAVDGNVKRVLARLLAIAEDVTRGPGASQLNQAAAELVVSDQPGDWNQALMELGATICLPITPRCLLCPLRAHCQGLAQGIAPTLPRKPKKKPLPHYNVTAAVIRHDGKMLIAQRPPQGMLGGMWEFPGGKQEQGETLPDCLKREIMEELGINIVVEEPVTVVKHSYTHLKITLYAFYCRLQNGTELPQALEVADWRWVTLAELDNFAFPRTDQKIIAVLQTRW
jgi:A/G-specific adenine glycosylase